MSEVTRYLHAGTLVVATEGITKLYPQAAQYVLASDYDQLKSENGRLTSELRAATAYMKSLRFERELAQTQAERAANTFHGMYQDAEGKIPVTAIGQSVGRIEYGDGSVGVQANPANRPVAMADGGALLGPDTWMEIDKQCQS